MPSHLATPSFRARMSTGEVLKGCFVKTPAPQPVELLGECGFDFVVIDAEHAPFDRAAIDVALLAAKAAGMAALVRVAEGNASAILAALDGGAQGVLVPHVDSPDKARTVAAACRYRGGQRGFSAAGRAGRYGGLTMTQHLRMQDEAVACIAMIEDPRAINEIDVIAQVEGIDAFFIGRGDLAVAMGASSARDDAVLAATRLAAQAARAAGKAVCIMADGLQEAQALRELGASAFILDSDQGLLRRAASAALAELAELA